MPRPVTLDHLRSRKKANTANVEIILDPDLADEYNVAESDVVLLEKRVQLRPDDSALEVELAEAKERLGAVRQRVEDEDAVAIFRFKSIPPAQFDELINYHTPTAEQRAKAKQDGNVLQFNPDTFIPALISACLVEPVMSVDEVQSLWKDENWSNAELQSLYIAAMTCNNSRRTIEISDLGKG